jgi:hypothetical protein
MLRIYPSGLLKPFEDFGIGLTREKVQRVRWGECCAGPKINSRRLWLLLAWPEPIFTGVPYSGLDSDFEAGSENGLTPTRHK